MTKLKILKHIGIFLLCFALIVIFVIGMLTL